ncbi:hypothetical protein N431DRAFT_432321 [Stipitochalara longipes BDJ]|nr:hypothetical protein N431DRAFT_432321 [Stipitochalara longipes BDJ]
MESSEVVSFRSRRHAKLGAFQSVPRSPSLEGRVPRHGFCTTTCAGKIDEQPDPPPNYPKDKKPPKHPPKKSKPPKKPPKPPKKEGQGGSSRPL